MNRQLKLTVLGSNSASPAYGRFPTSQYLNINDHSFLIDCGEGSQVRIAEYKLKRNKLSHIFISHMHGDHIFGLPGLITSMNLNSRQEKLTIIGPVGIKEFLDVVIRLSYSFMSFETNHLIRQAFYAHDEHHLRLNADACLHLLLVNGRNSWLLQQKMLSFLIKLILFFEIN